MCSPKINVDEPTCAYKNLCSLLELGTVIPRLLFYANSKHNSWDFEIHGGIILLNIIIETILIHANYGGLKHMNKVRLGLDYDHIYILQSRRLAYK